VLERGYLFQSVTQDGFFFNESADAGTHLSVLGAESGEFGIAGATAE